MFHICPISISYPKACALLRLTSSHYEPSSESHQVNTAVKTLLIQVTMTALQDLSAVGSSKPVGEQPPVWRHAMQCSVRPLDSVATQPNSLKSLLSHSLSHHQFWSNFKWRGLDSAYMGWVQTVEPCLAWPCKKLCLSSTFYMQVFS